MNSMSKYFVLVFVLSTSGAFAQSAHPQVDNVCTLPTNQEFLDADAKIDGQLYKKPGSPSAPSTYSPSAPPSYSPSSPSSKGSCFAAGTRVNTPSGYVEIQNLKAGDKVYSYDLDSNTIAVGTVTATMQFDPQPVCSLKIDSDTVAEIVVTKTHPFYQPLQQAWLPLGIIARSANPNHVPFLRVQDFVPNKLSSWKKVNFRWIKENIPTKLPVYNITVDKFHNYFVEGILVHNKSGGVG